MTLIETIVVISIISILSAITAVSFPVVRDKQRLVADANTIEALLQEAQLRALNEVRSEDCLARAGDDKQVQRHCSNVGVALQARQAILFSDFNGDRAYTPGEDMNITERELATDVTSALLPAWQAFVFEALPPTVAVYADGAVVLPASSPEATAVSLQTRNQTKTFSVRPYGIIQ